MKGKQMWHLSVIHNSASFYIIDIITTFWWVNYLAAPIQQRQVDGAIITVT
jgi:hypothetical protein